MKILFLGYDAWGDWISYNGLIRYLAERFDTVYIKLDYGGAREPFVKIVTGKQYLHKSMG